MNSNVTGTQASALIYFVSPSPTVHIWTERSSLSSYWLQLFITSSLVHIQECPLILHIRQVGKRISVIPNDRIFGLHIHKVRMESG